MNGYLHHQMIPLIPRYFWKASGGSFFFLNALAALSVAIQVKGLEGALRRERDVSQELEKKTSELAAEIENRRQTEAALRDSQRRLADIIDFLPDPTWVIDRQGKVLAWNRAMEELTGVPARDMLGKGDYEYALPFYGKRRPTLIDMVIEPQPGLEKKYPNLVREGRRIVAEGYWPNLRPGGIYVSGIAGPLFDAQGELVGAIESLRDITARKKAEKEHLERERLMAAIETSGAVCHELNQPLQAIMAKAEMMMIHHQQDQTLKRDLEVIISETERMSRITRRLQRITAYKTKEYLSDTRILDLDDSSP
jgi:PAS domain S-box-containing protein